MSRNPEVTYRPAFIEVNSIWITKIVLFSWLIHTWERTVCQEARHWWKARLCSINAELYCFYLYLRIDSRKLFFCWPFKVYFIIFISPSMQLLQSVPVLWSLLNLPFNHMLNLLWSLDLLLKTYLLLLFDNGLQFFLGFKQALFDLVSHVLLELIFSFQILSPLLHILPHSKHKVLSIYRHTVQVTPLFIY